MKHWTPIRAVVWFVTMLSVIGVRAADAQVSIIGGTSQGWGFHPQVSFGYDTFGQTYTISDRDTLDLIDELSARFAATLRHTGTTSFLLTNRLGLGEEATRNDLRLALRQPWKRLELRWTHDAHYRGYKSTSSYTLSSDYLANISRLSATVALGPAWRLRVDERYERADYAERTRFSYDYWRNDLGAEAERRWGLLSSLRAGYAFGTRSVPDSAAIDYQRHVGTAGLYQQFGMHNVNFQNFLERRLHRDPSVRSDYLDYVGSLGLSLTLQDALRLRPTYEARVIAYDQPDSIYSDAAEQSVELLLEKDLNARATLGVGPRGQFRRTGGDFDRPYNQLGVKGTISYLSGSFWVQFTNELGKRSYFAGSDFIYTDYVFNWSTLYLSYSFRRRLALDLYFSLSPENHVNTANDITTILVSTAVTWTLH